MSTKSTTTTTTTYGTIPTTTSTTTTFNHRPSWREFFFYTFHSISFPISYTHAISRIRHNLRYFLYYYSLIILFILFLALIYHPISMILFLLIFSIWVFFYFSRDHPIVIANRRIPDEFVVLGLSLLMVLGLVFTHVGVNVLVGLIIGFVVVGVHGAFLDEEDLKGGGDDGGFVESLPLRPTYGL